jgi:TATA-binding protein-associated factor
VAEKRKERRFLEQLLDTSKIDNFEIPVKIAADLRRYQQEGINWMAFMLKYQLHGILCDDMGLGKTLQSICIMASSHHNRRTQHAATKDAAFAPFPSLVVCPPTLVGHWAFEISKFLPDKDLSTVQFVGSPAERAAMREDISGGGDCVVITSYDTLRNEIGFLGKFNWNYCILDEGHVIKNGKSKTTQAVKTVKANHRLLLSGTPIQNNALELWSLFDFLMPGFLGTEKSFSQNYSKPILASRNAKCSSREAEAGALALESLHRQVLPFMLRRTKTEVLSDLPPKIIQDMMCELSPLQQRLYNDFASKQKAGEMVKDAIASAVTSDASSDAAKGAKGGSEGSATHIFQALQYLRKLSNHPKLVLGPEHPEMNKVNKMLKEQNMTLDDISLAPKLLALRQILWDCGIGTEEEVKKEGGDQLGDVGVDRNDRHRVLIFAQMKGMLDIIEKDLFKKHLPSLTYLRMDGSTPNARRFEMQQQFNGDPSLVCVRN